MNKNLWCTVSDGNQYCFQIFRNATSPKQWSSNRYVGRLQIPWIDFSNSFHYKSYPTNQLTDLEFGWQYLNYNKASKTKFDYPNWSSICRWRNYKFTWQWFLIKTIENQHIFLKFRNACSDPHPHPSDFFQTCGDCGTRRWIIFRKLYVWSGMPM